MPLFIERFTIWEKIGWQYALAGVLLLLLVFVIGVEKCGARNWISIGGFELQPSEFVKLFMCFSSLPFWQSGQILRVLP
ncbi:MAG: FtsW/RodA/SpoVE family cell cycle protein [Clostridium sp.]